MKTVGVLGAGTMGGGIAQLAAQSGFEVLIFDSIPAALGDAQRRIRAGLDKGVARKKLSQTEADQAFKCVPPPGPDTATLCRII